MISVYKITHIESGRGYIGISRRHARRWSEHVKGAKNWSRNSVLASAIREHGAEAFTFVVLYEAVDALEAWAVERGLIAEHGTMFPNGYNRSNGGEPRAGVAICDDTKRRLSAVAKAQWADPEQAAKRIAAMQGRVVPEYHKDHLRRLAAAQRGKKRKPESVEKGRASLMGHACSEDTRRKIGEKSKGRIKSPEEKQKRAATMRSRGGLVHSANARKGMSEIVRAAWSDPIAKAVRLEKGIFTKETNKYGLSTAFVRAMVRQLPCEYYYRTV